jgi:metal-responsive CopG/Arc/MetJ family transcriptional regulator
MKSNSAAISLHLPFHLVQTSQKLARQLHMSRAQFMRMAIEHEIKNWQIKQEQMAMAKCFLAMHHNEDYLKESDEIIQGLDTPLTNEKDEWWKEK